MEKPEDKSMQSSQHSMKVTHNLTLACLIEASVPKPGNVSPTHAFHSTRYEHYLAGSVAVGLSLGKLTEIDYELSIGETVFRTVENVMASQSGGNTHLGIILLLAPLAKATIPGITNPETLRSKLRDVLDGLDSNDAAWYYKAINLAQPGGLLPVDELDVRKETTLNEIQARKINVKEWMDVSKEANSVSYEYLSDYELTFEMGLSYISSLLDDSGDVDINEAVLRLYLKFLSERLDTLVLGKFDTSTAEHVKTQAREILELYEDNDPHAKARTDKFNSDLTAKSINPGMSADLTAATIYAALVLGLKL
jgi:triphosphoribosyl-dephospho-CoA synthase